MNKISMRYDNNLNNLISQGYYNPTQKDLDQSIVKRIYDLETDELQYLANITMNTTAVRAGTAYYLANATDENMEKFRHFIDTLIECTENELKNASIDILKKFKKAIGEFQVISPLTKSNALYVAGSLCESFQKGVA